MRRRSRGKLRERRKIRKRRVGKMWSGWRRRKKMTEQEGVYVESTRTKAGAYSFTLFRNTWGSTLEIGFREILT